jgi:hypothetical protein
MAQEEMLPWSEPVGRGTRRGRDSVLLEERDSGAGEAEDVRGAAEEDPWVAQPVRIGEGDLRQRDDIDEPRVEQAPRDAAGRLGREAGEPRELV